MGKTVSDKLYQHFLRLFFQGNRNESKNKQVGPNYTYKVCKAKETRNKMKRKYTGM